MRIMIDTNVLISAFVFGGKTGKLLDYLLNSEHKLLVSDYVDKEFKDKLDIKWHNKAEKVYELYHTLSFEFFPCQASLSMLSFYVVLALSYNALPPPDNKHSVFPGYPLFLPVLPAWIQNRRAYSYTLFP